MVILRFPPGEIAPASRKYHLVDHFGDRLNVSVWCNKGERLPLVAVDGFNPVWYVQIDEAAQVAQAA